MCKNSDDVLGCKAAKAESAFGLRKNFKEIWIQMELSSVARAEPSCDRAVRKGRWQVFAARSASYVLIGK